MKRTKTTPRKSALGDKLEALAVALADELKSPGTPIDERIGGFKALTAYYAMINRLPPPKDEGKGGFGGYKESLDAVTGAGRERAAANGADSSF